FVMKSNYGWEGVAVACFFRKSGPNSLMRFRPPLAARLTLPHRKMRLTRCSEGGSQTCDAMAQDPYAPAIWPTARVFPPLVLETTTVDLKTFPKRLKTLPSPTRT